MERIQSINPERLAWCLADRGVSLDECAAGSHIAAASLEKVLAGEGGLSFVQLRKLAAYFGRGVLFFVASATVDEKQAHSPQFRTLANQKPLLSPKVKALIERAERQRSIYLSLRDELGEDDFPKFSPPEMAGRAPAEAAVAARRWLDLGARNDFDSYRRAVEAQGILVFRSNGYAGEWQIAKESPILGFSLYDPQCPVIVVKKQVADTRQVFTLMHELGHLLLHKASSIDDEDDMQATAGHEQEANAFAGHLLVPDAWLDRIRDGERPGDIRGTDEWLAEPRKALGVSGEVVLRRLLDAGRLPRDYYTAYRRWRKEQFGGEEAGGSRKYRHREPKHIFGDTYVRAVLTALAARQITLTKASSYLDHLKLKQIHQLERYYAASV